MTVLSTAIVLEMYATISPNFALEPSFHLLTDIKKRHTGDRLPEESDDSFDYRGSRREGTPEDSDDDFDYHSSRHRRRSVDTDEDLEYLRAHLERRPGDSDGEPSYLRSPRNVRVTLCMRVPQV